MSTIQPHPTVKDAVNSLEEHLLGAETQVFWSNLGAVVLTDEAVYEVYLYGEENDDGEDYEVIIQQATLERGRGWEDVTSEVSLG